MPPAEGDHVVVPPGMHVVLDATPPPLATLAVRFVTCCCNDIVALSVTVCAAVAWMLYRVSPIVRFQRAATFFYVPTPAVKQVHS